MCLAVTLKASPEFRRLGTPPKVASVGRTHALLRSQAVSPRPSSSPFHRTFTHLYLPISFVYTLRPPALYPAFIRNLQGRTASRNTPFVNTARGPRHGYIPSLSLNRSFIHNRTTYSTHLPHIRITTWTLHVAVERRSNNSSTTNLAMSATTKTAW